MKTKRLPADQKSKSRPEVMDPGYLMLLVYTVVVGLIIIGGGLMSAEAAERNQDMSATESTAEFNLEDLRQGELLLPGLAGNAAPAVQLNQEVKISVSGIAARVRVSQEFLNTGTDWVNGVYVFPLPDESAVDRLRMIIGDREVVGEIREKEEARAIYEQAKKEGRKTSLLAQQRPNIFTTRVANIGPGEKIIIEIEYQQLVHYTGGIFSLRFPMTLTPRYIPGSSAQATERRAISFGGEGWARDTDQVADASQITPPVASPASGKGPRVSLSVDLVSGFELQRLESLYHVMAVSEPEQGRHLLNFTGEVLADRDFVLEWQAEESERTSAALLSEHLEGSDYLLLMLTPPMERPDITVAREVIFILDVSGSMAGPSIAQAKEALRRALARLRPADRFNIVSFSDSAHELFPDPMPGTENNLRTALSYLDSLQADGGTEMKTALELALDGSYQRERIRQVIFLTDGAVGNEDALFGLINARLGDSRLFTVGIGSAPNSFFMTRAATMGRGSYTFIGDIDEVGLRVDELLTKIEAPALTNIRVTTADGSELEAEVYPDPLPDLYFGEPLQVALRMKGEAGQLLVSGEQFGQRQEYLIDTTQSGERPGIGTFWARKKIRSAMESLALGADPAHVKTVVLETALKHKLVSKYTSLVAVDKLVTRPDSQNSRTEMLQTAAPRGLQMDAVFGGGARTATPALLHMLTGGMMLLGAAVLHVIRRRMWRGR